MKVQRILPLRVVFINIFSYKGFKLNVFMTYSFDNVIRLDPVFHNAYSDLDATPREFKNVGRWLVTKNNHCSGHCRFASEHDEFIFE